jgi:hypothetical protein
MAVLAEVLALLQWETGELWGVICIGAVRRNPPLSVSPYCWLWVSNSLSLKSFHGVLTGLSWGIDWTFMGY